MARPGPTSRPRGQLHVGRYFGALAALLAALYAIVFLAGPGSSPLTPRLGLDLQGGASVVLTPRTETGKDVRADQLQTAVEIIQQRVNGLGVAEAEVVTQGNNIVVSVPGGTRDSLRSLAQTAQLRFRQVLDTGAGDPNAAAEVPSTAPTPQVLGSTGPDGATNVPVPAPAASPRGRALPGALVTQASPAAQTAAQKALLATQARMRAAAAAKAAAAKAGAAATP
ncbi:MAG: secD, partial [Frankiales bacterium]|nr:secD [Frankiales bacterium]